MQVLTKILASVAVFFLFISMRANAQASLLLEQPYGFFGALNPAGHEAIYIENICADSPIKLRRCNPGEDGVVISRYSGIDRYDWAAVPLVPYLYSVEQISDVPQSADRATVERLRSQYHERQLMSLGDNLKQGDFFHGGWSELVGASYERRVYAFRFATTSAQDDAVIALLSAKGNQTHFNLLYSNCADFAREVLNIYFPGRFRRSLFPDAGVTTPKQITYTLVKYARKHPETELMVFEIPQIPGYRRHSRSNHGITETFITKGYAIPIALLNPYLAGGLFVDYLVRGRVHPVPKHPELADAEHLNALTNDVDQVQNPSAERVEAKVLNSTKKGN